jgi:hypothetical protein
MSDDTRQALRAWRDAESKKAAAARRAKGKRGRQRRAITWMGYPLGRAVSCERCTSTIEAGAMGFKRSDYLDGQEWRCIQCVPNSG